MCRLERAFDGNVEIVGLLLAEFGELHSDLLEVESGDFLVELLRQDVDAGLVGLAVLPEFELGEGSGC